MRKKKLAILVLVSYAFLMGCGTQGPLYIPEQRYPQKTQDEAKKTPETTPAKQMATE
jgi:predicted small lipoprotein YifL